MRISDSNLTCLLCLESLLEDGVLPDGCDSAHYLACGFLAKEGDAWRVSDAGRVHLAALRSANDSDDRDQNMEAGVLAAGAPNIRS